MKITQKIENNQDFFIIPIDHPQGEDTPRLNKLGVQGIVNQVDYLNHDGYIFHAQEYQKQRIKTRKDFFLTVGEQPEGYKLDFNQLLELGGVKKVTLYFEVESRNDWEPYGFYQNYVQELKNAGFFIMAMGFPASEDDYQDLKIYQQIVAITQKLGCDILKTDYFPDINKLNLGNLALCVGSGPLRSDDNFEIFLEKVMSLPQAHCSFGRNIFEAENYENRINKVMKALERKR